MLRAGTHAFAPAPKLSTHAELLAALAKLRSRKAPFLADLAPALLQERLILELAEFDWHEETNAGSSRCSRRARRTRRVDEGDDSALRAAARPRRDLLPHQLRSHRSHAGQGQPWACFDGVDYKAHVFVNGAYLGSHEGFFAPFEFEFTACAALGTKTLLVKVENDYICMGSTRGADGKELDGDKIYAASGPGYDDPEVGWHHCPPAMGIYQDVQIEARPRLFIRDLFVRPCPPAPPEAWIEVFNCDLSDQRSRSTFTVRPELPRNPVRRPPCDPRHDRHPRSRRPDKDCGR